MWFRSWVKAEEEAGTKSSYNCIWETIRLTECIYDKSTDLIDSNECQLAILKRQKLYFPISTWVCGPGNVAGQTLEFLCRLYLFYYENKGSE